MHQQVVRIEGVDVHVEGDGASAIVMIHGWPDTYRLWDAQVAAFADRYRCVRFTLPGFDVAQRPRLYTEAELVTTIRAIVEHTCAGR